MARRRKERTKPQRVKPDEVFTAGPLTSARIGRFVHSRVDWPPGEFEKMQARLAERYPELVGEIDSLVSEIASLVSELPPEKLLHRAWWELSLRATGITSEAEMDFDDGVAVRMVDYIQSVIAAVPPSANQRDDVTEEAWKSLREKVERLFRILVLDYHLCATAQTRADNPAQDLDFEEFKYRAQVYWCTVRGTRYQVHQPAYLRDMFLPFSDVLQELFGITAEQFVEEITKIWRSLSYGIGETVEGFKSFQTDVLDAAEKKIESEELPSDQTMREIIASVVEEHGWQERQERALGRLLGLDLFDVQKVANLPQRLLDEMTWSPGEEQEFFAPGQFRGWPLRIWPIFRRPFIRLNGRPCCFDLYGLFDNLYRVMQRIVTRLKPEYAETWNQIQKELSEALPFKYLRSILPSATQFRPVYYRARTGAHTEWCEADGILIYDDHLFVIEVRAGAFTYTPPATDFPAYVASLRNLVLKPATQGKRFIEYLNSGETVPIFDRDHLQVGTLKRADFRHVTICAVTIDPFTEMAAQVQHLRKIGVDVGSEPVWALSVDDLRAYADVFENPLVFLHFVEQRMQAFRSDIIQSDDEFDHLGLYLKHNHYATHAKELRGDSGARITFQGYRSEIDKYFSSRMADGATRPPLRQKMPARLFEIVDRLARTTAPGLAKVASYLLDLNGKWRENIAQEIDEEIARQPSTRRPKPMSVHGGVPLTVFCWVSGCVSRDPALALRHTRKVLLLHNDPRRLLLELVYSTEGVLQKVDWQWIDPSTIPAADLPTLRAEAERLRGERVAAALAHWGKIGRNEQCPCGSGKKYKKCHLGKPD
ncbi:SEC-C motif domain protein [Anaeromyxobacter sp. K]|uniref:YecA family protein n=1 Tax=Anaeromyxobacter sp. (strain K) TaxID=447217 RepID=UPI00015F8F14|nr:SEC-C metal-binding domain-containing protein [Anaeromyxobacter sp. K]ACG72767.1 SEC-C motif domain protein [Anaeromyxobacter sp. K]